MKKIYTVSFIVFTLLSAAKAGQTSPLKDALPENNYKNFFDKAYQLHPSIPKGILEAVACIQSTPQQK